VTAPFTKFLRIKEIAEKTSAVEKAYAVNKKHPISGVIALSKHHKLPFTVVGIQLTICQQTLQRLALRIIATLSLVLNPD